MKTYYTDYVRHCLRFYTRYKQEECKNDTSLKNWIACNVVLKNYGEEEKEIIDELFKTQCLIIDKVDEIAFRKNISSEYIWQKLNRIEKEIAIARGL